MVFQRRSWLRIEVIVAKPIYLYCFYLRPIISTSRASMSVVKKLWIIHFLMTHSYVLGCLASVLVGTALCSRFMDRQLLRASLVLTIFLTKIWTSNFGLKKYQGTLPPSRSFIYLWFGMKVKNIYKIKKNIYKKNGWSGETCSDLDWEIQKILYLVDWLVYIRVYISS